MQEGPVEWNPVVIEQATPWQSKLFVLYLLAVIAMALVKSVLVIRQLCQLRKMSRLAKASAPEPASEFTFLTLRNECSARIRSLERSVIFTFLFAVLVAADQIRGILAAAAMEKHTGPYLYSSIAEALAIFVIGVLVCAIIYGLCDIFHCALSRRDRWWNLTRSAPNK